MKSFLRTTVLATFFSALFSAPLYAQQAPTITDEVERHLATPLTERKQLIIPKDVRVPIPEKILRDMRFDFEKRMALTGHGVLYDSQGREVTLKPEEAFTLQEEMLKAVRSEKTTLDDGREEEREALREVIEKLEETLRGANLDRTNRFSVMNALTRAEAYKLDPERRDTYLWRSNYLSNALLRLEAILITDLIDLDELISNWWTKWLLRTDYMNDCDAAGVPVPPNLDVNDLDSPWKLQGQLTTKLIFTSIDANVWTWHEPGDRGACVALPRGTGGAGSLAGIICQGAGTGNACFWDNLPKGGGTRIPWATEELVIKDLQDGTELAENCTGCHKGNNVFLVSPDDPIWCRLLRGQTSTECAAIDGTDISNFTLAVEANVRAVNVPNTSIWHARYSPMSGTPSRPGWENNETLGCGGACHLGGTAVAPPPMPPACGVDCY